MARRSWPATTCACASRAGATLEHSSRDLFPRGGDVRRAPVLDRAAADDAGRHADHRADALPNLYLNTGHGTLGWTMACGSGGVLADLISGRQPDIEHADLAISRYAGPGA